MAMECDGLEASAKMCPLLHYGDSLTLLYILEMWLDAPKGFEGGTDLPRENSRTL